MRAALALLALLFLAPSTTADVETVDTCNLAHESPTDANLYACFGPVDGAHW